MLLGRVARPINLLGALLCPVCELLGLILDFLMQALDNWEDGTFDALLRLGIRVDQGLGIGAHVLEEAGHAPQRLIEVLSLPKGFGNGLQHLLVLLGVAMVYLLDGTYIVFQVDDGVFPGLQTLGEKASGLRLWSASTVGL